MGMEVNLANKSLNIEKHDSAETAGSIAQAAPQLFTPAAETAGSIASAGAAASAASSSAASSGGSSGSFSAMG